MIRPVQAQTSANFITVVEGRYLRQPYHTLDSFIIPYLLVLFHEKSFLIQYLPNSNFIVFHVLFLYYINLQIEIFLLNMNDKPFHNISNHTSPINFRDYQNNYRKMVTPIVIKYNTGKSSSKIFNKKSTKNLKPKYLYNPPYALQKQKLLFDIQKENEKLKHQRAVKKNLQRKFHKKVLQNEKKNLSQQKLSNCHTQELQGIERTITSSLQKPLILHTNLNYIKSINNQMEILTSEIQKNSEIITKIKRSKKYTRYLENKEEKNAFLSELRSLKIYRKKLRLQMNKIKRIHQERKNLRIKELMMEGEIQNTVEMQNIKIYQHIQGLKQNLRETTFKKAKLEKKKQTLIQQIQHIKERHNITDQIVETYYRAHLGNLHDGHYSVGYQKSKNTTQYRPMTCNLNNLASLKEQDYEEDESIENFKYQQEKITINKSQFKIKPNATSTVKVHSNVPSDDGQFMGYQYYQQEQEETEQKQNDQRRTMQKLDQKYFYGDEDFESESENSQKQYDSQQNNYNEGFESQENHCEETQQKSRTNKKMVGVKEQKLELKAKENIFSNKRVQRGLSI